MLPPETNKWPDERFHNKKRAILRMCPKADDLCDSCQRPLKEHADTAQACPDLVTCYLCGKKALAKDAHRHQGKYIGDECCWDERLKQSE